MGANVIVGVPHQWITIRPIGCVILVGAVVFGAIPILKVGLSFCL
jgi:hypothetical protein